MRKLILRNHLSPGDIVMLSAAVRDLHKSYPRQFLTDVRTSCGDLWENNPYITPLSEDDSGVEVLECAYPLINDSNRLPYHCLHGFIHFLNEKLNLEIRPTAFRGDIHLSDEEKNWFSQVHELAEIDLPYWVVAAGGKYDITIKWWSSERYQKVIDYFRGKIQFVQIGAPGHFHPKLKGTIDLRGKTSLRQLIRLIYNSQGVLCGVTAAMHLAAAVETKPGNPRSRPCVVVAGGREPVHWEAYPDHQFISTNGALPCCTKGGCWRARVNPLGDGDERDKPDHLCVDVVSELPRCMDMIGAAEVCRRIELYFKGGVARYLNDSEKAAARLGVRRSNQNSYDESALTLHNARLAMERFAQKIPGHPMEFSGRGIVICGGGVRYFTNAWVCIHLLRHVGCNLPIELWHLGPNEIDDDMRTLVEPLGVTCVDAHEVAKRFPVRRLGGWQSKPYAILHSRFQEVLFLDADNVPVANPESLFETDQYKETGAIFWPDYPSFDRGGIIWESSGVERPDCSEFESGQIVVDKARVWHAMRLALWLNEHSDFYYQHLHGDKETYHIAFHKLKQPYGFIPTPIHRLPGTMCQHDFNGARLFQHRNTDKWNLFLRNRRVPDFWLEDQCFEALRKLQKVWDGRAGAYLKRPEFRPRVRPNSKDVVRLTACMISCAGRTELREVTLANLRATDWADRPLILQMDESPDPSPEIRQTETALRALEACLQTSASHVLFLEDDLQFNRHIFHNLITWEPLRTGVAALASLYNPGHRPLAWSVAQRFSMGPNNSFYGSQAIVLSREALKFVIEHWQEAPGKQDLKISRLVERMQSPMFYHAPSLVQHVGKESSWGGDFHQARDFDPDWRA